MLRVFPALGLATHSGAHGVHQPPHLRRDGRGAVNALPRGVPHANTVGHRKQRPTVEGPLAPPSGPIWWRCYLALGHDGYYDCVPLATVAAAARAVRVQRVVWRPMLAAHSLPRRVTAWAARRMLLCEGLAPGCPAATHWLAMLILCWRDSMQRLAPRVVARDYVDDLVAHASGPDAVGLVWPIWEVTQSVGRAAGLRLNAGNCVRSARAAAGRWQLRDSAGPRSKKY